jgi:hypothetical protein
MWMYDSPAAMSPHILRTSGMSGAWRSWFHSLQEEGDHSRDIHEPILEATTDCNAYKFRTKVMVWSQQGDCLSDTFGTIPSVGKQWSGTYLLPCSASYREPTSQNSWIRSSCQSVMPCTYQGAGNIKQSHASMSVAQGRKGVGTVKLLKTICSTSEDGDAPDQGHMHFLQWLSQ